MQTSWSISSVKCTPPKDHRAAGARCARLGRLPCHELGQGRIRMASTFAHASRWCVRLPTSPSRAAWRRRRLLHSKPPSPQIIAGGDESCKTASLKKSHESGDKHGEPNAANPLVSRPVWRDRLRPCRTHYPKRTRGAATRSHTAVLLHPSLAIIFSTLQKRLHQVKDANETTG